MSINKIAINNIILRYTNLPVKRGSQVNFKALENTITTYQKQSNNSNLKATERTYYRIATEILLSAKGRLQIEQNTGPKDKLLKEFIAFSDSLTSYGSKIDLKKPGQAILPFIDDRTKALDNIVKNTYASPAIRHATVALWDQFTKVYAKGLTLPKKPRNTDHFKRAKAAYDFLMNNGDGLKEPDQQNTENQPTFIRSELSDQRVASKNRTRIRAVFAEHVKALVGNNLNGNFQRLMKENNIVSTNVSGNGNNCLIHAFLQHATGQYNKAFFPEAAEIREKLQEKFPSLRPGEMLHYDNIATLRILEIIEEMFNIELRICFFYGRHKGESL